MRVLLTSEFADADTVSLLLCWFFVVVSAGLCVSALGLPGVASAPLWPPWQLRQILGGRLSHCWCDSVGDLGGKFVKGPNTMINRVIKQTGIH